MWLVHSPDLVELPVQMPLDTQHLHIAGDKRHLIRERVTKNRYLAKIGYVTALFSAG